MKLIMILTALALAAVSWLIYEAAPALGLLAATIGG